MPSCFPSVKGGIMRIRNLKSTWYWATVCTAILVTLATLISVIWLTVYTRRRSQELFEKSMDQFQLRVETYLEDFQRIAKQVSYSSAAQTLLFGDDRLERLEAGKLLTEQTTWLSDNYPALKNLLFLTGNGQIYTVRSYYTNGFYRAVDRLDQEGWMDRSGAQFFYLDPEETGYREESGAAVFTYVMPVYSLLPGENFGKRALCLAVGDLRNLPEVGGDFDSEYDALMVLNGDQTIYSRPAGAEKGGSPALPQGWGTGTHQGRRVLTFRTRLKNAEWDVAAMVSDASFLKDAKPIRTFLFVLLTVSLALMFLIMLWALRQFSEPIRELKRDLERIDGTVGSGASLVPVQVEEIDWVRQSINGMIARLEAARQKEYESEERLYQATILANQSQLRYYQSQINPHFLYNSLECIRSIAQLRNVPEICEISLALARLFRYSIDERWEVPLSVELQNVQDYFNVTAVRRPGQFELKIFCPDQLKGIRVKKMILQPLVENAIGHGFQDQVPPYLLSISCGEEDGELHIWVTDNGCGIDPERLEKLQASLEEAIPAGENSGVGLKNLSRRLSLSYPGRGRVKILSREGFFTQVELIFPVDAEEKEGNGLAGRI